MLARIRVWNGWSFLSSAVCAFAAAFIAVYVELFHEACVVSRGGGAYGLLAGELTLGALFHVLVLFLVAFVALVVVAQQRRLIDWLFDHRVAVGIGVVALCVLLELSGSSLSQWDAIVGSPMRGTILGMSRALRGDEWAVYTPFACSQQYGGFQSWSSLLSGGSDVTMVYAQPCWAPATVFRPFLWGYLLLGFSHGLAFFWSARTVALFLVSLEMGLLVTRNRRGLSLFFALLITFGQAVQWWYAVNGMAELFIFGQGIVLALHRFLHSGTLRGRWSWAACMAWLGGCYIFILYPAWQVALEYVFAALGVWVVIDYRRSRQASLPLARFTVLPLACCAVAFGALAAVAVYQAWDVISAVRSSVYPGSRFETGGTLAPRVFDWGYGLFAPIVEDDFLTDNGNMNACEYVGFFGLFPLGLILAAIRLRRQRDALTIATLVAYAFLGAYAFIGFTGWLARITLLSNVQAPRVLLASGYMDLILLVRTLSLSDSDDRAVGFLPRIRFAAVAALVFTGFAMCFMYQTLFGGGRKLFLLMLAMLVFACAFVVLAPRSAFGQSSFGRGSCMVALACAIAVPGLCVNPLQMGTESLADNAVGNAVAEVQQEDPGLWIADESWQSQLVIAQGAPALTSVSTYPHLALWGAIDEDGSNVDAYNRYAWIAVRSTDGASEFEVTRPDSLTLRLALSDARKLGVTYWLSGVDLEECAGLRGEIELVRRIDGTGLAIYRL